MNKYIEIRALTITNYILKTNSTIRQLSNVFGLGRSSIHLDLTERLTKLNPALANDVKVILDNHKAQRHINGGNATKEKYAQLKKKSSY